MQRPEVPAGRAAKAAVTLAALATVAAGLVTVADRGGAPRSAAAAAAVTTVGGRAHGGAAPKASPAQPARADRQAVPARPRSAWIRVSVATIWLGPHKPRNIDRQVLSSHPDVHAWLRRQTVAQRLGLADRLMTQGLLGDRVVVLEEHPRWDRVRLVDQRGSAFPRGIVGWVPRTQLTLKAPAAAAAGAIGTVTASRVHLRAVGRRLAVPASYGTQLPVLARSAGAVTLSLPGVGPVVAPRYAVATTAHPSGAAVLAAAKQFLGVTYLLGGTSAWGIDCSGLTYLTFRRLGILLPRDAADQARLGRPVSRRQLRPGDLVFFGRGGWQSIHHVGIYAGNGLLLHAPHTGSSVRFTPLRKFHDFWGARRYLPPR